MQSGMSLSFNQTQSLMKRLPKFELSYETIAHKKVSDTYTLGLAIPNGKKYYAWFSFQRNEDVCYLMELNREKKIGKVSTVDTLFHPSLSLGTLVYGTMLEPAIDSSGNQSVSGRVFLVEDIFLFKGVSLAQTPFGEKMGFLHEFMKKSIVQKFNDKDGVVFAMPVMWTRQTHSTTSTEFPRFPTTVVSGNLQTNDLSVPSEISAKIPYPIHHIQFRELDRVSPFLNVDMNSNKIGLSTNPHTFESIDNDSDDVNELANVKIAPKYDFRKPQYQQTTVFQVSADIQFDIYRLYAGDDKGNPSYYGVACIPNYKTSLFMNGLFRNIRESRNLDFIEESDDEDDFQNMHPDKYVDLSKKIMMECIFNVKHKKWIPVNVSESKKQVHISKLIF
jgi:hypothetical protein